MSVIKCIAFDCFGTIFDMSSVPKDEIRAYVEHVNKQDFTPFRFPFSWWGLNAHADAAEGIKRLQDAGFVCVTLSNGSHDLLTAVSKRNGIEWNRVIDLTKYRVYKPHVDAYRVVGKETGFKPEQTLMVTANPKFGDIEKSAMIGMPSQVIRHGFPNDCIELASMLISQKADTDSP